MQFQAVSGPLSKIISNLENAMLKFKQFQAFLLHKTEFENIFFKRVKLAELWRGKRK